jgi:mannose-6-phosphate isomerase-like protein (cupin superfamily)
MRTRIALVAFLFALASLAYADQPPGVVIDHQYASTREYVGSPSILIAPNGDYIATHDLFGPGSTSTKSAETKVFVSNDRGAHWKQTASFQDQFWSNLFAVKGRVYLMGTTAEYGHITIRTSDDNGQSWSEAHYLTKEPGFHTAPVPVVFHNGRIYRAFEFHPTGPWGSFQAFMMWAEIGSDLTNPSSWSFSNRLSFPVGDEGDTWLEGNAVLAPDGSILDVLRVNNQQHVAILKLSGSTLKLERFVDFPGGATKFSIRYDPVSKLYWALTNPALPGETLSVSSPGSVRNTLALMSSPDLMHWTPRVIVFHHPDRALHGFQYVDWQIDGQDIILASRTAFDDDAGGAHTFHDANYLTFYRIRDFRKLGFVKLNGSPFTSAEVISPAQIQKWTTATAVDAAKSVAGIYSQPIGRYGSHTMTLSTRIKTGEAEQHRDWSDIFVVISGEASLVSGGHLMNARTISPGEMRGSGITGGTTQNVEPGSIVHIGAMVPHQLILTPGNPFTYFVVKVKGSQAH